MEWQASWEGPLQSYLQRFDGMLRDAVLATWIIRSET
jgi:hypothetical protein